MLYKDVVQLVSVTHERNELGELVPTETLREVYAEEKGVRQSEFYAAALTGLRLEKMFLVLKDDYEGEEKLIHEGKRYDIHRTYPARNERLELVCKAAIDGG